MGTLTLMWPEIRSIVMEYAVKTSLPRSSRKGTIGSGAYLASTSRKRRPLMIQSRIKPMMSGSEKVSSLLTKLRTRSNATIEVVMRNAPGKSMRRNLDNVFWTVSFDISHSPARALCSNSAGSFHHTSVRASRARGA